MKRPHLFLMLALIFSNCTQSNDESASENLNPSPMLFEISNDEGHLEGWLFGTIHALPSNVRWQTPLFEDIVNEAEALVVEAYEIRDRNKAATIFSHLSQSGNSQSLLDRLDTSHHASLKGILTENHVSIAEFDQLETWAAALVLSRLGLKGDPRFGVDHILMSSFPENRIYQVEGLERQLTLFDQMEDTHQHMLLIGVLSELTNKQLQQDLITAWLTGDESLLASHVRKGILADPTLYQALLADRNRQWMRSITRLLNKEEKLLFAFGAAHLIGPDSIVNLLSGQGFKIRRIQ